jgi:hypothetical protein
MAQVVSGQIVRQDYALRFQTTSAPVVRLHFHHRLRAARRRMVTHGDAWFSVRKRVETSLDTAR